MFFRREGIGDVRLAEVHERRLTAMTVRRAGDGVQPGEVWAARVDAPGRASIGDEVLAVAPWPAGLTQGARLVIEVTRAAIPERGRLKPARARPAPDMPGEGLLRAAPAILARDQWPDWLAEQWDDAWTAAELGRLAFPGGVLLLTPTPAHLAVDVDGDAPPLVLAMAAVRALAAALRLYGVGGSVVLDLPSLPDKAARTAVGEAFDAAMAPPHERTAINGYGLMQVILPRQGPSIIERAWYQRAESRALALLEAAARDSGHGPMRLVLEPDSARWLEGQPALPAALSATTGRPVAVTARAGVGGGHVEAV
ncbi:ribonuclease [Sandaracinobacteroides saxicola]|uniref:Ribonuclease n=1 Tax=Sandaracinobacteroides saxicola TaxID=2759707 RepID=A0A7G5IHI9_9SPHN|nr:ribonuclease [Sandaracinobacteroides saxicola]QMW22831.1 ribonuclease [Sandaracinobacteroides saxicola]